MERVNEIQIHSNEPTSMSKCTLSELQPPELTHMLRQYTSLVDSTHSMKFPMNDVYECILPTNSSSILNENPLLAIFGMFNVIQYFEFRFNEEINVIIHQFRRNQCKMPRNSLKFSKIMPF